MRDELTCWAYVTEFNGQQAALAIVGEPDTDDPAALRKAKPVLDRMRRAYEGTREHFADAPEGLSEWRLKHVYGDDIPPPERRLVSVHCDGATVPGGERLVSVEMVVAEVRAAVGSTKTSEEHRHDPQGEEATRWRASTKAALFLDWLRSPMADFERQTFVRNELARWVQAMGASSLYLFADPAAQPIDAQSAIAAPPLQAETPDVETPQQGRRMKKAAMIKELERDWPTIKADLREASRPTNQDLKAANVEHGMWDVEAALRWAVSRGKTKKKATQSGAPSPFAGLVRN